MRIEIDDQDVLADGGQRRAKIDRGRGLADAALLVGDGQNARRLHRLGPWDDALGCRKGNRAGRRFGLFCSWRLTRRLEGELLIQSDVVQLRSNC